MGGRRRIWHWLWNGFLITLIILVTCGLTVGILEFIFGWRHPDFDRRKETEVTQSIVMDAVAWCRGKGSTQPARHGEPTVAELMANGESRTILMKIPRDQFDGQAFRDGWGRVMRWEKSRRPGSSQWVLVSAGKDGVFDTGDDIRFRSGEP